MSADDPHWRQLTGDELELKQQCRQFAEAHIAPSARQSDRENALPRAVHAAAHEAGLMNVGFPVALGGRGVSARALAAGGEELAAACAPTAFSMGFNHGALRPVLHAGTPEQQDAFVRALLSRRGYASVCLTEAASSGSNLPGLRTRAVRTGRGWALSGRKCMVGNGCDASLYLVLAEAFEGQASRGLTFFAVPRGDGVEVGENTDKLGFRCVTTPEVAFLGAEVDDAHRIGAVGGAEGILAATLDYMRFGGTSVMLGLVTGALRDVAGWIDSRIVHPGGPLSDRSHVQLLLGDLFAELRTTRMGLFDLAERLDRGEDVSLLCSMSKLRASRLAVRATQALLELYGWRGIDGDWSIQKRARDARVTTIFEGTTEIQLLHCYRALRRSLADDGWL